MKIKVPVPILAAMMTAVYALWCRTLRLEFEGAERIRKTWDQGRQTVVACWHNELFCFPWMGRYVPWIRSRVGWLGIVSASKDGDILTGVLDRLGFAAARGSSSRGGLRALMGAVRELKKNPRRQGFVTVDGPRGPRHEVKDGALLLAHKAGALMVPARVRCSGCWVFARAWDRFELPKPFSRCRIIFGEPYEVTAAGKLDKEKLSHERQKLTEKLNELG